MFNALRFNQATAHPRWQGLSWTAPVGCWLAVLLLLPSLAGAEVVELPQTVMPQLDAPAVIERDVDGIAHVNASTEHDLFFLQGWIHAEDRLFQMDVNRRQPSGTLAVLFGTPALASDVELRTLGLRRAAEASLGVLSDRTRAALQAYADGVNAWVANNPLPAEYGALELGFFTPWTPVDSVVIGKLIAFGLSFDLDIGLTETLLTYQATGEVAGFDGLALFFEDLFRSAPFDPASTLPDAGVAPPAIIPLADASHQGQQADVSSLMESARQGLAKIGPVARALNQDILHRMAKVPMLQSSLQPRERIQGSNEWAVSGNLTDSGRPLIANDPHLALNTPSTFYQIHLRSPQERLDVIGSGFPGVPFVILGQNSRLAWGATTNPMDVTDTFLEQIVPDAAAPSRLSIIHQGQREPILDIPQTFFYNQPGNGVANDIQTADPGKVTAGVFVPSSVFVVPRRNNGPVLAFDLDTNTAITVQYAGFGPTREVEAFRVWNRARNLEEFVEGLQLFDVGSQNWVVGDVFGNIAYFTSGEMPIREDLQAGTVNGLPPYFIRDGTGGNEWLPVQNPQPEQSLAYEILPFSEMPQLVNPPAGWFVNANNDPAGTTLDNDPLNQLRAGGTGIYYLNPGYASGFRAGTITRRLRDRLAVGTVSAEDMAVIQSDVSLLDARVLVPEIIAAFNRANSAASPALIGLAADPTVAGIVGRLAVWDHTTPTGIPEGFDAAGIDGLRFPPDAQTIRSSVAATVYSVWRGQVLRRTIDAALQPLGLDGPGSAQAMSALRNLLDNFPANQGFGASGIDFFPAPAGTSRSDARDLALLGALRDALDLLAGPEFEAAFGGSDNVDDYRWGRLHRIVLDHPLGPPFSIPPAFGGFPNPLGDSLPGIPVDGGFGVVDASSHSARADGVNDFMFGSGPVRRYVAEPGGPGPFIDANTILPGGASGVPGSPFLANLLPRWLTNDTYPVRQAFNDYQPVVVQRMRFAPAGP